jgi:hypothetical protein
MNRSASLLASPARDGNPELSEPGYGLLAFARDLHAERCRLDQQALEAARQTLAQEASEK